MPKDDLLVGEKRAEHLDHLLILEMVETPPHGFAVEADLDVRARGRGIPAPAPEDQCRE